MTQKATLFGAILAGALSLTGCATVTMAPAEAVVEAAPSAEQTALRAASLGFVETSRARHWCATENPWAEMAKMLRGDALADRYWLAIEGDIRPTGEVWRVIEADLSGADRALSDALAAARDVVASGARPDRADLATYEQALVSAQQAERAFAFAIGAASARAPQPQGLTADTRLGAFSEKVSAARGLADRLSEARDTGLSS